MRRAPWRVLLMRAGAAEQLMALLAESGHEVDRKPQTMQSKAW